MNTNIGPARVLCNTFLTTRADWSQQFTVVTKWLFLVTAIVIAMMRATTAHGQDKNQKPTKSDSTTQSPTPTRPKVIVDADSPSPAPNARNVRLDAVVRLIFDQAIAPETLTSDRLRLLRPGGRAIPALVNVDRTGGLATLTPLKPLTPRTIYTIDLQFGVRGKNGKPAQPYSSIFTTGSQVVEFGQDFAFKTIQIEERDSITAIEIGPDEHLYAADARGLILRHQLDPQTGTTIATDVAARLEGRRISSIAFDPSSKPDQPILWVGQVDVTNQTPPFVGVVSRIKLGVFASDIVPKVEDVIVGLPCAGGNTLDQEQRGIGIGFGSDKKLYVSSGGLTALGGASVSTSTSSPKLVFEETPLSASVLQVDLVGSAILGGKSPYNVTSVAPTSYDPKRPGASVIPFATGLGDVLSLCWHSNGQLYAGINSNKVRGQPKTPGKPGVPAINATPHDMLCRIRQNRHYGHPNPSRGQFTLNGGNPTIGLDPWEISQYPVGVRPDSGFDPSLIHDLHAGGGSGPSGLAEYRANGPLKGWLVVAYRSGGKCVQAIKLDEQGRPIEERPLVDVQGARLPFNGPRDVAVHPGLGTVYVADFGDWTGGDPAFGKNGGVWLLTPRMAIAN